MKFSIVPFLKLNKVRYWYVTRRFKKLKKNLRFHESISDDVGINTIKHNLTAFDVAAGFGCGGRMNILIFPIAAIYVNLEHKTKILIVGCRTEDDIFWMKSYGFNDTLGFDLFSYSDLVVTGDIHKTDFADNTFDVVLLGWMISYSKNPEAVFKECARIIKPNGHLGVGLDHNPTQKDENIGNLRMNYLNSAGDITKVLDDNIQHKPFLTYDHTNENDYRSVVITQILK
jgi:SAM-dependent methyltransferase